MSPTPERRRRARQEGRLSQSLSHLEVIVCCGSGGVGKTTVSAALAAALAAEEGRRVLVLTVDPARRLATALGLKGIGTEPVVVSPARLRRAGLEAKGQLVAAMLDQKSAWDRMVERHAPSRQVAERILRNRFYQGISDAFVGSHEYMAMETLYDLHEAGEYDIVVVDTPPSRNALDFLEAPERFSDFVGARLLSWLARPSRMGLRALNFAANPFLKMADRLIGADVLSELADFVNDLQSLYAGVQQRAKAVARLLRSPRVGFVVVTTLEPEAFAEAEFFAAKLRAYSMPLRAVVVNRVLPDWLRDADANRLAEAMEAGDRAALSRLSRDLDVQVDAQSAAAIARAHLFLAGMAQRDSRQLGRLERLQGVSMVRVPLVTEQASELEGLARVAASF